MWIARDEGGTACIYDTKPVKDKHEWVIPNSTGSYSVLDSELGGFEEVKWEDEEPTKLTTIPTVELMLDKLGDILGDYLHGGEIDEAIALFEGYLISNINNNN